MAIGPRLARLDDAPAEIQGWQPISIETHPCSLLAAGKSQSTETAAVLENLPLLEEQDRRAAIERRSPHTSAGAGGPFDLAGIGCGRRARLVRSRSAFYADGSAGDAMADWDPELYHRFSAYRAEPFTVMMERLARAGLHERIVDLGCGTGENTVELARRLTATAGDTLGIDSSPAMIERALELRGTLAPALRGRVRFERGDVREFAARREYSMIFSNAVFQWLGDHRDLFRRCFEALVPGGLLAVQVPANDHETAQVTLDALAHEEPWRATLDGIKPPSAGVAAPEAYDRMLNELGYESVDCHYRTFRHPMGSPAEIVEWCRATVLRRYMDNLPPDAREPFISALTTRLEDAYGTRGPLTFDFRRLFIWARRPAG